ASWIGRKLRLRSLDVTLPQTGPLHLSGSARTEADALEILSLKLTGPGSAQLSGRLGYRGAASQLKLAVAGLRWPLVGPAAATQLHDLKGSATVSGTLAAYHFRLQMNGRARQWPVDVLLQGTGGKAEVQVARLRVAVQHNGQVDGHGQLQLAPQFSAALELTVAHFNPASLWPDFPGDINGHVRVDTVVGPTQPRTIRLTAQVDHSRLRHQPLELATTATVTLGAKQPQVTLQQLKAVLGRTTLDAHGRVTSPFAVRGTLQSPDLSRLDPHLAGRLQAHFDFAGTLDRPRLTSIGQAEQLRAGSFAVGSVEWNVQLNGTGPSRATARLADLSIGRWRVTRMSFDGRGTARQHQLALHLVMPQGRVQLTASGRYDLATRRWSGELNSLTLAPERLAAWSLTAPAPASAAAGNFVLRNACLTNHQGRLCASATWRRGAADFSFESRNLQLAAFAAFMPKDFAFAGSLDGAGQWHWHKHQLHGAATLTLDAGTVQLAGVPRIVLQPSELRVDATPQGLQAQLELKSADASATVDARVASSDLAVLRRAPLTGSVAVSVPSISFTQAFTHGQITDLAGRLAGQFTLGGTLTAPTLAGKVALTGGGLRIPAAGIKLADVELDVSGTSATPLAVTGQASSGGGRVALSGTIDTRHWPVAAEFRVQGQQFQIMDTPDARIWVSPDLKLARSAAGFSLGGSLLVPRAELTPQSGFGSGQGVAVSPDQVIVGAPARRAVPEPNVRIQLALILGKQVSFDGFGLNTRIAGGVVINQAPRGPALAQGQLFLQDGRYKAYGQDLTISTGRLIFDGGPVTKPAIDIVAMRKPRADVTVGVQVRGTLDKPQLALTSTPAMSQAQQLSWLLFGRPLDQGNGSDQSAIAAAALSLGLGGGDLLASRIGSKLGIDEVSLGAPVGGGSAVAANASNISGSLAAQGYGTAQASAAAQLTLGKYLTPRLFVSYGVSLFQPGQVFRMLYDLGHGFKIRTESGTTNGGDLIYSFEAGH
ncbi:MAG TPA: translocation/assembly module TamB domain-containing protein, partial [Nevskiaceae bacterium]|nr:translocation/assembly module TamB domain-containing protein [Nevskiaceae bacterium]